MRKVVVPIFILSIFSLPGFAYAQPQIGGLVDIFYNGVNTAMLIVGIILVGMLVYAGYMWMIAAGDPQKIKMAQGTITWAIIGAVFIFIFRMLLIPFFNFLTT